MLAKDLRRIAGTTILLGMILFSTISARAQGELQVILYGLQTGSFPAMSGGMDVYDAAGNFVTGLQPGDVIILEDNQPHVLDGLVEDQPGLQLALAINTGPAFGRRDDYAVTRLNIIRQALEAWARGEAAGKGDQISLVANGMPDDAYLAAGDLADAISTYEPDTLTLVPSLDILSRALDLVALEDKGDGQKRAVLFISSLPELDQFAALQEMTARAISLKVHVHVWIVADQDQFTLAGATALKDVAIQTGGQYFIFSGTEQLPSLETSLAPLRHTYTFQYTSTLTSPGGHTISATVNYQGQSSTAAPIYFELDVQPPNPILLVPPNQILRQPADETNMDLLAYLPGAQTIGMLVEFPDGHPRPLVRTALYVDGEKVVENSAAPFEEFSWDLRPYTTSGQHILQVEAVDTLGLSRISLGVPVNVTVLQPSPAIGLTMKRYIFWIAGGALLLVGGILAVVLTGVGSKRLPRQESTRSLYRDPVTQPVLPGKDTAGRSIRLKRRITAPQAYLVRLRSDGQAVTAPPIPLAGDEITFGNDPTMATNLLDDPSISPLHACLTRKEDGTYILEDKAGSPAGTWVNFEQLTAPCHLQHGDVFHIGQIAYRFMLRNPPERPGPRLSSKNT